MSKDEAEEDAAARPLVVGHGVDTAALSAMRTKSLAFFQLPHAEKMRYSEGRGYGFGGYLDQEENGAQLLGDFGRPADVLHSDSDAIIASTSSAEFLVYEPSEKNGPGYGAPRIWHVGE